jgi:UDP-glucuronate 4-epimerase
MRFFTVYGPWGRPDMALFLFTKAILSGQPIQLFNHGQHRRCFTYIDDLVDGIMHIPKPDCFEVYNIGSEESISLTRYVEILEQCLGKKALVKMLPLQPGDVPNAECDASKLKRTGWLPRVSVEDGVQAFVDWYQEYNVRGNE